MTLFSRIVLALGGLSFLFFGGYAMWSPANTLEVTGIVLDSASGRIEARAFYGGLELALGTFMTVGIFTVAAHRPGLWLMLAAYGGIALARVVGIAIEGETSSFHNIALGIEALMVVLAAVALRR